MILKLKSLHNYQIQRSLPKLVPIIDPIKILQKLYMNISLCLTHIEKQRIQYILCRSGKYCEMKECL